MLHQITVITTKTLNCVNNYDSNTNQLCKPFLEVLCKHFGVNKVGAKYRLDTVCEVSMRL